MAFRLAREEGLFAGTSTGCNVIAALRLAEQLGPDATIVTVMCDTGMKYLRTYGTELSRGETALESCPSKWDPEGGH
jgi:cysteine synthase A